MLHYVKYSWLCLFFVVCNLSAQNGWIHTYTNAQFGLTAKENEVGGYTIAGFKGIQSNNILLLQIDADGEEVERYILSDFNKDYTFQENNVELLLTSDNGLLASAHSDEETAEPFVNLLKYTNTGELVWQKEFTTNTDFKITALAEHSNGYLFSSTDRTNGRTTFLTMIDFQGEVLWYKQLADSIVVDDIAIDTAGNIVLLGKQSVEYNLTEDRNVYYLAHFNSSGNLLATNFIPLDYLDYRINIEDIAIGADNSLTGVGDFQRINDPLETVNLLLFSMDYSGSVTTLNGYQVNGANYSKGKNVIKTDDNSWVLCGVLKNHNNQENTSGFYAKINDNGLIEWTSTDATYNYGVGLNSVIATHDNGFLFVGQNSHNFGAVKAIKTNHQGVIETSVISGNVFKDVNDNCTIDSLELILKNAIVKLTNLATGEVETHWSVDFGFDFRVDTGRYLITVQYLDAVWESRCDSTIVQITDEYSEVFVNVPLYPKFDCPLMTVDLTTPIVERCEETTYKVQVINNGTTIAEEAYLDVELDKSIELLESSRPFTTISDGLYRFQLGNVNISSARAVDLLVKINCDSTILGQTHCASAYVYPDSLCIDLNPEWDGSIIDVDGNCLGDSIGFQISNSGSKKMGAPLIYYVIEDDAIFRSGNFQLDPGESIVFFIPSNGATYRVETEENPGYLFGGRPSFTVEGCGAINLEAASLGFVNRFPLYDNAPFVSIDCQENIIDLEGNLHLAYPKGYADMQYIRVGDELEYFIRFEQTNEQVINKVEVIDTLDEWVDINTINIGVTSHPYSITIEEDRILKLHFNDINLSSESEGSNYGFLKFKVKLKDNVPTGTVIENQVLIAMDSTIIETETVYHTLGQELVLSFDEHWRENTTIHNYPNPFIERSKIILNGIEIGEWQLQIYNTEGRLVRRDNHNGSEAWIEKGILATGIYFFTIEDEKGLIGSGKLVVQ